jgi:hypothetical protein
MSEDATLTNEVTCLVCGRPMAFLRTIRRAFGENLNVFQCKPCGFSSTEPVSWTTPPLRAQAGSRPPTVSLQAGQPRLASPSSGLAPEGHYL